MTLSPLEILLSQGVSKIVDEDILRKRIANGEKLRVKFGIDPTGTIVHLGHMVPILKLRAFQDLGHQIVLIIGDSTAQVGDTSDKESERPMLTREQTRQNAENWIGLFGKVLDISRTEIRYNSEWMDTINFNGAGELAKHFSVAEMLDRDNFSKRYKGGQRISLQEFLYPIMQGYDSVAIQTDVELGGNDQYFNLLAGRTLQAAYGQEKQAVMTFRLLLGGDGRKMSKTEGNCIAVGMSPRDMYVKAMEIGDEYVWDFFELSTLMTPSDIQELRQQYEDATLDARSLKKLLAHTIVSLYHSTLEAGEAEAYFESVVSGGATPELDQIEKVSLSESSYTLVQLLKEIGFASTTGDARNMISGGGIKVDGTLMIEPNTSIILSPQKGVLVQSGKKKFRLVFSA